MKAFWQWTRMAVLGTFCWILCEVAGGLFFLALGLRLWTYDTLPIFWEITSPAIWLIAFILMPPLFVGFRLWEKQKNWKPSKRLFYRSIFLIVVGCSFEVMINEWIFKAFLGRPLFTYTFLSTFEGSGSWLSPLYYMTLYLHFPLMERLEKRSEPKNMGRSARKVVSGLEHSFERVVD